MPQGEAEITAHGETSQLEIVETTPIDPADRFQTAIPAASETPNDALRSAIKAAVDAGDLPRATALLAILSDSPKPAGVIALADRRRAGK